MKITGSKIAYSSPIFTIKDIYVETLAGPKTFQVLDKSDSVVIFAINNKKEVYFVREFFTALGTYGLALPGGRLDTGDTPEDTARKELQEEVGFDANRITPLGVVTISPGYITQKTHLFLAQDLTPKKLVGDEPEELEVVSVPFDDIEAKIHSGEIHEARDITAYFIAKKRFK